MLRQFAMKEIVADLPPREESGLFDRRLACTLLAVLVVTATAAALAIRTERQSTAPLGETVSGVERDVESSVAEASSAVEKPDYLYIIREHEGRVAVFSAADEQEPEMILDTLVKYLPDYDRSQLAQGIPVYSYQELVSLIEDFVS